MELVTKLDHVRDAMEQFHKDLPESPGLASRLGQAHAFYMIPEADGSARFAFSKFVGYRQLTADRYLNKYKKLDGRNTEHALKPWFDEVKPGSSIYVELHSELSDWLAGYGKSPRRGDVHHTRIMVLKPEFVERHANLSDDRRLLNLIIAVASTLPVAQRGELRAAL